MSHIFEVVILCITIFAFIVFAIMLFAIITHLIYKTIEKWRKKNNKDRNKLITFLIVTIVGILSFELSLIFTIAVTIEILLIDDIFHNVVHFGVTAKFFSSSYIVFEYLIAAFDSLGHLAMLYVFISRFQYTFSNSIIFD
eukprot:381248_1